MQTPNIVKFFNKLRNCGVGPSGQITKLQTRLNAVKMMVPYDGDDEETRDMVVKAKVVETGNDSQLDPGIFIIFSDDAQLNGIMRAGKDKYEELL